MKATLLRKVVKRLAVVGAIALVLVGVGFGVFRVLVTRLPSYQTDLQAWVSDSLGLTLDFSRVDARWALRGPELTFQDARIGANNEALPFLTARAVRVGLSPLRLLTQLVLRREPGIDRLTFDGIELTFVQDPDGTLRLQGAPASAAERASFALEVPPDVEVNVRDSHVVYLDQERSRAWDFQGVSGRMHRESGTLLLEARGRPPSELGSRIVLTAQAVIEDDRRFSGDWRVFAEVRAVDLAVAGRVLPATATAVPQAGNGDVSVWLEWHGGVLTHSTAELALNDVVLPRVLGTAGSRFERIAFTSDWQRNTDGWRLALRDLAITRSGLVWPSGSSTEIDFTSDASGPTSIALRSDFLRLEDLTPFFSPLPESRLLEAWFALAPRGDLRDTSVAIARDGDRWDYTVAANFSELGVAPFEGYPGFEAVSGEVRADPRSGRIDFRTHDAAVDWTTVFRERLDVAELTGIVVWRQGQDAIRFVSDDLVLATADATTRSNLELTLPTDGSSPRLDLTTTIPEFDAVAARRYYPVHKMPPGLVAWLDSAIQGGRVHDAEITFVGPLAAFPFDGGEGELRATADVDQGTLKFIRDWPAAEELNGTLEFLNASFATRGSGRILGNRTADVRVGMADMRAPVLTLQTQTIGPLDQVLAFFQSAPLIARHLGPDFARLQAPFGTGEASVDLKLPLRDKAAFELAGALNIIDGELAYEGFAATASEINGSLSLKDGAVTASGIEAIFLDGPMTANVVAPDEAGYHARLDLEGEVTIDAVTSAFNLPLGDLLAGQTRWQGSLLIPTHGTEQPAPARITVGSNLEGVAMRLPEPFAKSPAEPTNLQLEFVFTSDGGLDAHGYLGATRRFAMQFDPRSQSAGRFAFRRAALQFGGMLPEFRAERGLTVDGSLPALPVDEWLALSRSAGKPVALNDMFAGANLDVADFSVFGQELGNSTVSVRRRTEDWQIEVDSMPVAGTILVPDDLASEPQIVAVMRRLYLTAGNAAPMREIDPRELPGVQLHADEFGIGARVLGRLDAEIVSDPLGLRLVSFESASASFTAQGGGGWFAGADGNTTRFAVSITSSDVAGMLAQLGFDPVIEAEVAELTASAYWPGPPSGDWLEHVSGDLALRAEKGSLLAVQPGAGRMVGLMSFTALPRRLALDFRDVFNKGFVFDEITGDFVIVDGNAYTDNLKLTGPAAEIGVAGRTGLRDRDYRQQAVVTAEPGKILPTVGLLGGPGVAAALLIFTRIFKKPLQGIGQSSYCLTGTWAEPVVERLSGEQLEQGEICAELPPGVIPTQEEVAAR